MTTHEDCAAVREYPSSTTLEALGPQRRGESNLARRVRLHQSWYRAAVLRLDRFGSTPGPSGRPMGSVLAPADALAGMNFTSHAAHELFTARRAVGWGLDPKRCTAHMTSSQALSLNLFGPLRADSEWFARVLGSLVGRSDLQRVVQFELEFAPPRRSQHLGDQTRLDALVVVETNAGYEAIVIEVKYADRFSTRRVDVTREPYVELAKTADLWKDPSRVLRCQLFNQLVRIDALASSTSMSFGSTQPVTFLAVVHEDDEKAMEVLHRYGTELNAPGRLHVVSLRRFVGSMKQAVYDDTQDKVVNRLHTRYVNESASASLWSEMLQKLSDRQSSSPLVRGPR
jgi:hypothetical protein